MFAVAAIEGWLNELLELAIQRPHAAAFGMLPGSASELGGRGVSLALKLQISFTLIAGKPLAKGAMPYQDFDLLVAVRNALIHMRSETMQYGPVGTVEHVQHTLAKRLVARRVISEPKDVMLPLISAIDSPEVGAWAYSTARDVVGAVVAEMADGDDKIVMQFKAGIVSPDWSNE